jgi:ABC-type molybdate transport system substrate-binding protein
MRMLAKRFASLLTGVTIMATPVNAADTILLHAAGSLRLALTEVIAAYEPSAGRKVQAKFGPSGTLKDAIAKGEPAEVFASANMQHPQALADAKRGGPVVLFARNRLCALVRPGLTATSATLLDRMLDPTVKLATSTPKADPSGDYAWEVFRKADKLKAGSFAILEKRALQLVGAPTSPAPPKGRIAYGWHVAEGRADIFLTYCTNALAARNEHPDQQIVQIPDDLAVGADYGLTVMTDAPAAAHGFALFILSGTGQAILAKHGFSAPGLPQ